MNWYGMDSAPKNGTVVWGESPHGDDVMRYLFCWENNEWVSSPEHYGFFGSGSVEPVRWAPCGRKVYNPSMFAYDPTAMIVRYVRGRMGQVCRISEGTTVDDLMSMITSTLDHSEGKDAHK